MSLDHDHEHTDELVCRVADAILVEIDVLRLAELEWLEDLGELSFDTRREFAHRAARRVLLIIDETVRR